MKPKRCALIRVFVGGSGSRQTTSFYSALGLLRRKELDEETSRNPPKTQSQSCIWNGIVVESKNVDEIKNENMQPLDLFDWLLESDVHFIIAHIHQGLIPQYWNSKADVVYDFLAESLCRHIGFPRGLKLRCPIFCQDKYRYIEPLSDIFNATLKINVDHLLSQNTAQSMVIVEEVSQFCARNCEGCGWVIKAPFTTNSYGVKFCKNSTVLADKLFDMCYSYKGSMSYLLIQPCLCNKKEYKVVTLNGKCLYLAKIKGNGKSFSVYPHYELFNFAESAVQRLQSDIPSSICSGLIRVDIMITQCGKLIINEFESLEAEFEAHAAIRDSVLQNQTENFLVEFWYSELTKALVTCNKPIS